MYKKNEHFYIYTNKNNAILQQYYIFALLKEGDI